jgi:hypothetical protein
MRPELWGHFAPEKSQTDSKNAPLVAWFSVCRRVERSRSVGPRKKYNDRVERYNSEGIARDLLQQALRDRRLVHQARRIDNCLLCRAPNVNEAGLCRVCWVLLDEEELQLAKSWMNGAGP